MHTTATTDSGMFFSAHFDTVSSVGDTKYSVNPNGYIYWQQFLVKLDFPFCSHYEHVGLNQS